MCWINRSSVTDLWLCGRTPNLQPEVYHSMLDWKESTEAPSQICGCVASTTRSVPQYAGLERINRSSVIDLWLCGIYNQKCTAVCWIGKNQQKLRHRFVAVWQNSKSTAGSVPQCAGLERINRSSVTDLWLCGIYNQKCTAVCWINAMPSDTRRCVLGRLSTVGSVRRCWISSSKAARSVPLCVC